jgi:outer membrane lipoprotein SlyB
MFMMRFDHPIRPTRGNRRPGVTGAAALVLVAGLAACGPTYSPDTYTSTAVQQAAKVEQGVLVGVREVAVSASGTVGTVTGAAAGGIVGSQVGAGALSALGALGGTVLGGLAGQAAEKVTGEPRAYEYIVRKAGGDLVSVTQKDEQPLKLGLKVLVIAGSQARIVPDYTVHEVASAPPDKTRAGTAAPGKPPPVTATPLAPPAGGGQARRRLTHPRPEHRRARQRRNRRPPPPARRPQQTRRRPPRRRQPVRRPRPAPGGRHVQPPKPVLRT